MGNEQPTRDWGQIASAALLGLATIASAYCGYEAARWNGEQVQELMAANDGQFESMRRSTAADGQRLVDVSIFSNLEQSRLHRDDAMVAFLHGHMRPELKAAYDSWSREEEAGPQSAETPFDRPEYRLENAEAAERLRTGALAASARASYANGQSDLFVAHSVVVALALFFLSMTTQFSSRGVRRVNLILGALLLAGTLISIARLPRPPGDHHAAVAPARGA